MEEKPKLLELARVAYSEVIKELDGLLQEILEEKNKELKIKKLMDFLEICKKLVDLDACFTTIDRIRDILTKNLEKEINNYLNLFKKWGL